MKKCSVLAVCLVAVMAACQNGQQPAASATTDSVEVDSVASQVFTPERLMAEGATLVDQKVEIEGTITHVCKHGGKKCSIMGEDPALFVQVMVGGDMETFTQEMIGTTIHVIGTVKERQITKEIVEQQEAALKEAAAKASKEANQLGEEHCSQSMHNVNKMKQWMVDNNKEYYPIYFVEGEHCNVVAAD